MLFVIIEYYARRIIDGYYGNGHERRKELLRREGIDDYLYELIRIRVNQIIDSGDYW